jgi:hypothetical protein
MATASEWSVRVSEWRASGKKAQEFCESTDYSAKSLLNWSSRLGRVQKSVQARAPVGIRLARVVRKPEALRHHSPNHSPVVVHVGAARVEVGTGTNHATLMMVLGALLGPHTKDGAR